MSPAQQDMKMCYKPRIIKIVWYWFRGDIDVEIAVYYSIIPYVFYQRGKINDIWQ